MRTHTHTHTHNSCGACTCCQELRAAHIMGGQASWDFLAEKKNFKVDPLKFPPFME